MHAYDKLPGKKRAIDKNKDKNPSTYKTCHGQGAECLLPADIFICFVKICKADTK